MKQWEDYILENGVLKNKLNINDSNELHILEETIVAEKLALLIINPSIGQFDSEHLKAIHKFLFQEIYEFAGKYREIDIFKQYTKFASHETIKEKLDMLLNNANELVDTINQDNQFSIARFLGELYYNLIMIHPFREGNGRTIREFIREFVKYKFKEYNLEYSKIDKKNFLLGITEKDTYPLLLAYEFNNALVKVNIKSK